VPGGESAVRVGASIGVAVRPQDTPAGIALLQAADTAMYAAKAAGRGAIALAGRTA
jgi:predicted signal transduction protein with EAL and GGDEF domain